MQAQHLGTVPYPYKTNRCDINDRTVHVIGSPLALSSKEYADKCWVEFADVKILQRPDVRFVHGRVQKVDPETRTTTILDSASQTEQCETYDYFIAATGLRRVWPVVPQSLARKTYLLEAGRHIDAVRGSAHPVLVVGGGKCQPGAPPMRDRNKTAALCSV